MRMVQVMLESLQTKAALQLVRLSLFILSKSCDYCTATDLQKLGFKITVDDKGTKSKISI